MDYVARALYSEYIPAKEYCQTAIDMMGAIQSVGEIRLFIVDDIDDRLNGQICNRLCVSTLDAVHGSYYA